MSKFDFVNRYSEEIYNKCLKIEKLSEDPSMLGYAYIEANNVIEKLMEYLGVLNKNYRLTISTLAEQGNLPEAVEKNIYFIIKARNQYAHNVDDIDDEIKNANISEMLVVVCKWAFLFKNEEKSEDINILILPEQQLKVLQNCSDKMGVKDLSAYILNFALDNAGKIKEHESFNDTVSYHNLYNVPVKVDIFSGLKLLEETGFSMSIYEILQKAVHMILETEKSDV